MDIIFGRDQNSGKLKISCNGKERLWGEPGSVDNTVSRQHCKLTISDNGEKTLINLNHDNETNLNGQSIVRKKFVLDSNTVVTLGSNGYALELKAILKAIGYKETYSIAHLKKIIEDCRAMKLKLQIEERRKNALRGFLPVITLFASILAYSGYEDDGGVANVKTFIGIAAFFLAFYSAYEGLLMAGKMPQKHAQLDKDYHAKCVCPNEDCGHFLPGEYDDMIKSGVCPYCHSRFKE